jgi:hypothetical protein
MTAPTPNTLRSHTQSALARREAAIRHAAYSQWAYRRCTLGQEMDDWLAAERDVDAALARRAMMIREAAYLRWVNHGCIPGHALEDWLAAETEVDATLTRCGILCAFANKDQERAPYT